MDLRQYNTTYTVCRRMGNGGDLDIIMLGEEWWSKYEEVSGAMDIIRTIYQTTGEVEKLQQRNHPTIN